MAEPDTTALRALIAAAEGADFPSYLLTRQALGKALDFDTVRALCDGYDEAQDYRARWIAASDALAAARQALADLIGELRGLPVYAEAGYAPYIAADDLRAVIDRHDPDLFQCVHCEQYRDVNDGTDSVAGMGCHDCAGRP